MDWVDAIDDDTREALLVLLLFDGVPENLFL